MLKNRLLRGILIAVFWLAVWQGLSMLVSSELLLPSPLATAQSFLRLMGTNAFWLSAAYSLLRVLGGYTCAVLFGCMLGILCAGLPFANALLQPLRSIMKAMPVASFIIILLLWMPTNIAPAFTAFVMVLPLVWANVQEGVLRTDRGLLEMAQVFRFTRKKVVSNIYLPSVLPYLLSACTTGIGFAWKAGVAAEVLARSANSIGKYLLQSKNMLETADMFAWTALVVVLSIALERIFARLLNRIRAGERLGGVAK